MALARMQFEGLGFSMVLRPGWKGVAMNPLHGGFISSPEHPEDAVLNVRCLTAADFAGADLALTAQGLERLLRDEPWGAPPRDLIAVESGAFAMVGASFPPAPERAEWVREWLVTDGVSLASGLATPLICLKPELIAECEEMLRSLRFE